MIGAADAPAPGIAAMCRFPSPVVASVRERHSRVQRLFSSLETVVRHNAQHGATTRSLNRGLPDLTDDAVDSFEGRLGFDAERPMFMLCVIESSEVRQHEARPFYLEEPHDES
jgi:hypothetical protein